MRLSMKPMRRILGGAICALTLFVVVGCSSTAEHRSTGEFIDDTTILAKAKAALVNDPVVSGMNVNVEVNRGVVALNGAVNGDVSKQKAEAIVRGIDGVRGVDNNLVVRQPNP